MKIRNVVSCFDGLSGAQIALVKAAIEYEKYYAIEVNKHAIKLTQYNFPNTIQLGDIVNVFDVDFPHGKSETNYTGYNIDLLIGGSPCQGFSINGNRLNFKDERSKLFFEFIRLRQMLRPKYWLLENVATMCNEVKKNIDEAVGVEGVYINSNTCSAQNRKRLYWTNIPFIKMEMVSESIVIDILENNVPQKQFLSSDKIRDQYIKPSTTDGVITINPKKFNGKQTYQQDRIYDCAGKLPALTSTLGNRFNIKDHSDNYRRLTIREQARLQTIPDSYDFTCLSELQASAAIGNGFTVDVIAHILSFMK